MLLFIVVPVMYKYTSTVNIDVRLAIPPVWEIAVHLAVAGDVLVVSFCVVLFPINVLDEIWD